MSALSAGKVVEVAGRAFVALRLWLPEAVLRAAWCALAAWSMCHIRPRSEGEALHHPENEVVTCPVCKRIAQVSVRRSECARSPGLHTSASELG